MTALSEYERLEAEGIWRPDPEAQRQEVILSLGDATLVIADDRSATALAHWSLPAMIRLNPGARPAIYAPSAEPGEELEIADETMIAAIEKVHAMIEARRPHPGRLRGALIGGGVLLLGAVVLFWLPGALVDHAARIAPQAKRVEIGRKLLTEFTKMTGQPCHSPAGDKALAALAERLPGQQVIEVLPEALDGARLLPGGLAIVGRNTIAGPDTPEVVAGFLIAAQRGAAGERPLHRMLDWLGPAAALRLLTTGDLPDDGIAEYAQELVQHPPERPNNDTLLHAFREAGVSSTPYAYALDPTGESVLGLIEADPFKGQPAPHPVLEDAQWVALQDICSAH
ncbi:hypothetical protein [Thioclava pacifica]|uniref:Uncharacterized protein n=1 Tax=Thioclava pacifica DSM 10166 TaxID=1353537 RepID=A0A074J4L9_9RHOB|nr:hypothetical protein [Thioclava pacifica]KEO50558.1 hypothetical protein TP2_14930 [Thioclava pacifica DSM 10166]